MNQAPLVSIVIPTYDRPDYLREALQSAVQQTYQSIEIIVSDNGSPTSPEALVQSFQDERIRFWRNQTNIGMFANTMNALKLARGKYVALLHDDDRWEPTFLEKLVPPLETYPEAIVCFCDQLIIDGDGKVDPEATEQTAQLYHRAPLEAGIHRPFYELGLIHKTVPTAAGAVMRRSAIDWDTIPPEVGGMYDLYLTYLCCRSGLGAYYCPERLVNYRVHAQTETMLSGRRNAQAKITKAKTEIFCYGQFMQDERLQLFHSHFRQQWLHAHTTLGIGLIRAKRAREARPYLLHALSQQRVNLRTVAALILSFLAFAQLERSP
ncbi:MAG: glycosyltransferase family 2 protein [Leptolyngbyaceae cyanobacterium SL_7_1]|nr:glycosyltransferase family 2 protein [Leptolyngbyaceae cyanobacterium SL_7_1]